MSELVCRIQDADGRGPYRPFFSHHWSEREGGPDPFYLAFPQVMSQMATIYKERGGSFGCAFRNIKQASAWFSPNEVLKLALLGYALCWIEVDEVLAENEDQLVVWSKAPLAASVVRKGWVEEPAEATR
jgi:hypothetical protein